MKKLFYLMVLALMPMFFTACSSDDEPTDVGSVETLYGTWQQTSGYAIEDGEKHHEKSISADDAEYLKFGTDGICLVRGGERGHFDGDGFSSYPFNFDEEEKEVKIGYKTLTVEVLSGSTLRLKYYYNYSSNSEDGEVATYKKVSDKIWDNL